MLRDSKDYVNQTLMGGLSGFESPIGLDRLDRIKALKSGDIGFVHSWDINTSVDGPGTRMTVFMSGCLCAASTARIRILGRCVTASPSTTKPWSRKSSGMPIYSRPPAAASLSPAANP